MTAPTCPYCQQPAEYLESSAPLYRGRDYGPAWACLPCQAWVGCHPGTSTPLGRLANKELRQAKMRAHAAFDPLWKRINGERKMSRRKAYKWLSERLGVPFDNCHIGMFDIDTCGRVVEVCSEHR